MPAELETLGKDKNVPLKDTFAYTARWDSVGLDCSYCSHFVGPAEWPDKARESRCRFHRISLAVEIGRNGYKEWEWFCKNFEDIKHQRAMVPIRQPLSILCRFGITFRTAFSTVSMGRRAILWGTRLKISRIPLPNTSYQRTLTRGGCGPLNSGR